MPRGTSIYDEAYLQERLWSPNIDPTLSGWWDASDLSTMAFGTGISSWSSKAGATNTLTQATGSAQPVLTNNYRNGRPYAVFNTSQWIDIASPTGLPTGKDAVTIATVTYYNTTAYSWAGSLGSSSVANTARGLIKMSNGVANFSTANSDLYSLAGINTTDAILVGTMPSTTGTSVTATLSTNGVISTGTLNVANIGAGFSIGRTYNNNSFNMTGGIGEFLIFNDNLSTYRINLLEGYLAWKWGIVERLPGTHPFKNRPPMIGD